ncbi:ligand-binding sensor domain-containing protein [Pseudobacter ginsenosidimutans]|uniref:histidine kinase n=1 Tax=Pseudobacter ginsenosidimutans TaxID=661488 RepID=A0A4Q7N088_9BACT|nr:sensor histidine kinase [Pseudobacter ginsenosidimutans]RZS74572.1 two component regulator with propeller domain [Pseudobacter ginsenosidimutans]
MLLWLLWLFDMKPAISQDYYFRHYQTENGLSNNSITCSIQDKNGFLWFGTKEGLNRFDGYQFKLFHLDDDHERTLTRDLIFSLFTDQQGTMWVGSQKGLYRYDEKQEKLIRFFNDVWDVSNLVCDRSGQLWFMSGRTVCRYNFSKKQLKKFETQLYFSATTLCLSESGDMWFASLDGALHRFDTATSAFRRYPLSSSSWPAASCYIERIASAGRNSILIGTSCQGLKQFDIETGSFKEILKYNPDKTTIYVRDILKYAPGEYWLATESGIFIMKENGEQLFNLKKRFLDPYSISDNAVYTLCKDSEGGVWAGTFFGGINYYPRQYTAFQKYYPDHSENAISGSAVREICEDGFGNIWIGTEDAGLNKFNKLTGKITRFQPTGKAGSISYYNIHGLQVDGRYLWIGTHEHGIDKMDIRTGKVVRHYDAGIEPKALKNNFGLSFVKTRSGAIYAGTGNYLHRYDPVSDGWDREPAIPGGTNISALLEDSRQTIWAGTHGRGVFYFNPATGENGKLENIPGNHNSLSSNAINAICEDRNGGLWFATEGGGLCGLSPDKKRYNRYTVADGLPSNYVFKVTEDNNGHLWISTSKGLINFDPATEKMIVYTKANGLLNDQFNYNSGFKDADGNMYFGSIRGMIRFRPETFSRNSFIPPVYITGLQVHNKELKVASDSSPLPQSILHTKRIELPYDQSSISIDFAALSYTTPEITSYTYKMEGLEKNWTTIHSNRRVYFTNIPPGEYHFKVKAAINDVWSPGLKELEVRILPPWWRTTWAWLAYGLLIGALAWYLFQTYHKRIEVQKEKEIYEAKFDFFTNVAHEIKTPLTLIKGPVENLMEQTDTLPQIKEDVLTMDRNTNRLLTLVSQILDFRQTETKGFSLEFDKVNINELLEENYSGFAPLAKKRNLEYRIELPATPDQIMADEEALNKILSNLFSNAIKYADHTVLVKRLPVEKEDSFMQIEFSNDGPPIPADQREKIFEPFYRLKQNTRQKGTGIGLTLARSLTELHKGELFLQENNGSLNIFVLKIPLNHQY